MRRGAGGTLRRVVCVLALSGVACTAVQAQSTPASMLGQVLDEDGHPIARVEVTGHWGNNSSLTVYSDAAGKFQIAPLPADRVVLSFSKTDFFRIENSVIELKPGENQASFTMNHATELQQKVEVRSDPVQIDPDTTSHQETLVEHDIVNTPVPSSHDLQQSLITMPNVMEDANGRIHVAGARQGQTEILLDGFEINDPSNGSFTPRLNVDAIQSATVETGGYGAQFAHAGAGILMLDTKTGDDKWRFGTTNFFPGISFNEGVHFGNWFPRATLSGPIKKGRAWFSAAVSAQHTYGVITGLPEGQNVATQWAGDSLLRAQVNITPRNILQASFLYNRSSDPELGLGPFTPLSTTTNRQANRYFVSGKDQIWMRRTLMELGVAVDTGRSTNDPQGNATYVVTPSEASGNYFQTIDQQSSRVQLVGNVMSSTLNLWGTHTLSAGLNADELTFSQQAARSEIDFEREDGALSDRATFGGAGLFHLSNTQLGLYAQDLWRPVKPVVFSVGMRADWDRLVGETLVQPRLAMNWILKGDGRMKFTLAWGEHYQPLNLSIIGQALDQQRTDVFYDSTGTVPLGNPIVSSFVLPPGRLSQPRSDNTTAEWDEKIFARTYVGGAFLLRDGRDAFAWNVQPSGVFLLENARSDRYVSGETWIRHAFGEQAEVMVDYTRSRATSNQVLDPTLATLYFSPQQSGPLLWDAPNRLLSRGWVPLPFWHLLVSYFFDYHSGFPFTAVNDEQQLVGAANTYRYPSYVSLNVGLEKQFLFRKREWAVRVSSNNITGHNNPDAVVNNVDAPNFDTFSGGTGRSFTLRLRLVTQH
jgi:hypothetical protein